MRLPLDSPRPAARLSALLLWITCLAACAPGEPPGTSPAELDTPARRLDLTLGHHPSQAQRSAEPQRIAVPPLKPNGVDSMALELFGERARFEFALEPDAWHRPKDHWRAEFGLRGYPVDDMTNYTLVVDGVELPAHVSVTKKDRSAPPGHFAAAAGCIFLNLESPPEQTVRLVYDATRGHEEHGRWIVDGRRFSGAGLPVWSGETVRREVPGAGRLRFGIAGESAFSQLLVDRASARVTFRIRGGGHTLFEEELAIPPDGAVRWHELDLAPELEGPTTLDFSVEGDFAYTSFFAPAWHAAESSKPPAGSDAAADRPDILVFQADTFRADNLTVYGGERVLAPFLEELAANSLRYSRARSVSSYTLPAHATMFSGLFPHQAGVGNDDRRLPEEIDTLAERLTAAGYRTGAVTDSLYVSRTRGFAQGFEWFDELRRDMAFTQERVESFLDADDGRPVFLFVQSYAVHSPYEVSDETRAAWGDVFDMTLRFGPLLREVHTFPKDKHALTPEQLAEFRLLVDGMNGLYRAAVVDFGQDYERFHRSLVERGALEDAYFVFTSDHGEAFLEHDNIMHKVPVFEEQTRIPLLVQGPGITPGVSDAPVTLIDFAPSIARWAGLEIPRGWVGAPFDRVPADRPVYVFECYDPPNATWAKIEDGKKLIAYEDPSRRSEIHGAFELEEDPGELDDVQDTADWPAPFLERMGREADVLLRPALDTEHAIVDEEMLEEMRALGYAGDS